MVAHSYTVRAEPVEALSFLFIAIRKERTALRQRPVGSQSERRQVLVNAPYGRIGVSKLSPTRRRGRKRAA